MQNYTYAALLYFDKAQNVKKKFILHILQIRMTKCYMNYNY